MIAGCAERARSRRAVDGAARSVESAPLAAAAESPTIAAVRAPASIQLDDDELVLLAIQPSLWFVPLACLGSLAAIVCAVLAMAWSARFPRVPWTDNQVFALGAVIATARMAWQVVEWSQRLYVLTDRRVLRRSGALRTAIEEVALRDVRHSVVLAAPRERRLDVGTLLFATGASSGLAWEIVRAPSEVHEVVREAIDRYGRGRG
ncbi:MAG: PH domain-containing protein [Phycisphaerales bacterium]